MEHVYNKWVNLKCGPEHLYVQSIVVTYQKMWSENKKEN